MSARKESFLTRWSRRKLAPAEQGPAPKPAAPATPPASAAPAASGSAPAPSSELPALDSLKGLASEYRDFLSPQVDEKLRRAALKKLFHDPHFNVMDGLDVYIDDYSKPDPIPEAMLKTLAHAKGLLFDEKEEAEAKPVAQGPKPAAIAVEAPSERGAKAQAPVAAPAAKGKA